MKKRIFAALLALVMLLGALPVTASAAVVSDVKLGDQTSLTVGGYTASITRYGTYRNLLPIAKIDSMQVMDVDTKADVTLVLQNISNDPARYYGIPSSGSVQVSKAGVIGNCSFDIGPYYLKNGRAVPGLRFNYEVIGEGTTTVLLTYYGNMSSTENTWNIAQYAFNVSTGAPEKPGKGTINNVHDDEYGCAVFLQCDDADNTKANEYDHDQDFDEIAPDGIADTYIVSNVIENDAYEITDILTYPWMCYVTVYGQPFVDYYNSTKGLEKGEHQLAENSYSDWTFRMYYNLTNGKWAYVPTHFPLDFKITATDDSKLKDIVLSYDGGDHASTATNLPQSETKRVNTGAKAKFTVSSDVPTCGCGKNCTFDGWKLDGDTKLYEGGDAIELSASATLYAQWTDSNSGGDNNPETPVGPGEGESDSGNVDFGKNQITVKCVIPKSAEDPTPVHGSLSSPLDVDTIVPGSGKMDKEDGTGSIDVYVTTYVNKYTSDEDFGPHTKKLAADTVTIPLTWNATTQKWNVPVNTNTTVEVVCETTNPPLVPPPCWPDRQ